MSIQLPAKVISVWQYILTHPITWAAIGVGLGWLSGRAHFPF